MIILGWWKCFQLFLLKAKIWLSNLYNGMAGWVTIRRIMPLCGSILQAAICQILSLAENPRWSRVWQKYRISPTFWHFLALKIISFGILRHLKYGRTFWDLVGALNGSLFSVESVSQIIVSDPNTSTISERSTRSLSNIPISREKALC